MPVSLTTTQGIYRRLKIEGQKPSLELFIQLVTMFNISVDEYIFPNKEVNKSSARRRLDAQLDNLDDKELSIVEATVNGLCKAKE